MIITYKTKLKIKKYKFSKEGSEASIFSKIQQRMRILITVILNIYIEIIDIPC